jgi:hypothetical protein
MAQSRRGALGGHYLLELVDEVLEEDHVALCLVRFRSLGWGKEALLVAGMVLPLRVTGQLGAVKVDLPQVACGVALRLVVKVH